MRQAHTRLFVFGTLRDRDVLELVLERDHGEITMWPASLPDHATMKLHDETYPVLARAPGATAPGLVLELDDEDMRRVAFFEGEEYGFDAASVHLGEGALAQVLLCGERATRAGPRTAWSLEAWQIEHKAAFMALAVPYMALYGELSPQEADRVWQRMSGRG